MSRPSFRPRPIDLAKPLPIIKSSKDLRNEDDVVVNRALPTIATGVDPAEEQERHLKQALLASVYGDTTSQSVDIPIPIFAELEAVSYPHLGGPFRRPKDYIRYEKTDQDIGLSTVDYDADFEDEQFLVTFNRKQSGSSKSSSARSGSASRHGSLKVAQLEVAMDILEKLQGSLDNENKTFVAWSAAKAPLGGAKPLKEFTDSNRKAMYNHWLGRRQVHKHSFLRLYQKQPDPSDTNPAVAFRPRDKDAAAANGRKLNTYENFKRGEQLRNELVSLRKILSACIEREKIKAHAASVHALQQRQALVRDGGPRLEALNTLRLAPSKDAVVHIGAPGSAHCALPASDLKLPSSISLESLHEELLKASQIAIEKEKAPKKVVRRTQKGAEKTKSDENAAENVGDTIRASVQPNLDSFGFDDYGNRFLRQMRYFAGGFVNCGVGPYDHRVFSAASERNTVRDLPHDPPPFTFPDSSTTDFSLPSIDSRDRAEEARAAFLNSKKVSEKALAKAARGDGQEGDTFIAPPLAKRPRSSRVRARVGRGGRIVLDRVTFERERGVKAASYPASVEAGGVYTAGMPFEHAPRVLRSGVRYGGLGSVALLQPRDIEDASGADEFSTLARPLRPTSQYSQGTLRPDGSTDYWPRRSGGKRGRPGRKLPGGGDDFSMPAARTRSEWLKRLRSFPAYSHREEVLVAEVSDASTNPTSPGSP